MQRFFLSALCLLLNATSYAQQTAAQTGGDGLERYAKLYREHCAVCHGDRLEGAAQGKPLVGVELVNGESIEQLSHSISNGNPAKGMPGWAESLDAMQIKSLALYISESRANLNYADFNYDTPFSVPTETFETQHHNFRLETVIDGLDPLPFSIAPMPDGSLLLTEKKLGLSVISADGEQSDYITGTPTAHDDTFILSVKQEWGYGWLMDVAPHPNYAENHWIYLYYGDRCEDCNELSRQSNSPVSMNKLVRGRIKDGQWVDEQVIWSVDKAHYGSVPDIAAGGRIAFDGEGHVFLSVGMKGFDNHTGVQDLSRPWGKIHRVRDDGAIPLDNPFMEVEGAMKSIWTVGHRSPQGLEFNHSTRELWETEMGPRGGDEVNLLLPGRNYGWPLYSKGVNYDGTEVAYGRKLGIEYDLADIMQPLVDLTPSPAVSSFAFYEGDAFPEWRGSMLVCSLKARTLYRMALDENEVLQKEKLIDGLVRLRDIEVGRQGEIYLLLEHNSGGQILRLRPVASEA